MDAAWKMMLLLTILLTLPSRMKADALSPDEADVLDYYTEGLFDHYLPFTELPDSKKQLQLLEAEKFTDVPISIFRKIFLSRT
jgi:hypothetical protein